MRARWAFRGSISDFGSKVTRSLNPLPSHEDSPVIEIDIFDTKAQGLEESQPTSVKQSGDQCMLSIEVGDDPLSILLPQHGW
jgi:hypothetical protein